MKNPNQLDLLRLARSENVGKSTFFRIIEIFGSAQNALEKLPEFIAQGGLKRQIKIYSASEAEKEIINSEKFGAKIISFFDSEYPQLLKKIPDPAPILTIKGNIDFFERDSVAIVGPRNASFGSINFAKKIALELGQNSIITVSGMARGIDSAAHQGSILSGTIGVIAGGINHIYPKENAELYKAVSDKGLLVSENAFDAPPKGGNFVQRNRIISGLSLALIVVEAGLKSGSLITAKFAKNQGREVFAVPGSPFDPRCHGTNRLIKEGAKMFENTQDVLQELANCKNKIFPRQLLQEPESEKFVAPKQKIPHQKEITQVREEIFSRLGQFPISIEEIANELKVTARMINIALVQLELSDKIEVNFNKVTRKF